MSADKHGLLSRVPQPPIVVAMDDGEIRLFADNECVADMTPVLITPEDAVRAEATAQLYSLAYDHALLLRALTSARAAVYPRPGVDKPSAWICIGSRAEVVNLDAAGCPVLTEELRAALRKAVGP